MDKEDVGGVCVCVRMQWDVSHKKEWNFSLCSSVNGPREYNAEWNKADREGHTVCYHSCSI